MKKPYSKNTAAIIIALIIILFACKKNTTDNNTTPPQELTFQKLYDIPINDIEAMYYRCFSQTRDNGFFFAGTISTYIDPNSYLKKIFSFLIKTDGAANVIWAKTYSINGDFDCRAAIQTSDGGCMLAGNSIVRGILNSSGMISLIKTNENGDTTWTKTIHVDQNSTFHNPIFCTDVKQTNDNGFIVLGTDMLDDWPFLLKTDAAGNIQWMKSYRHSIARNVQSGKSVIASADNGGVFVASIGGGSAWILVKTKSNGDIDWNRCYASDIDDGFKVANIGMQANDGGYVFTGSSPQDVIGGRLDATLIKTNANGNIMWWKEYGGDNANESESSIIQTTDGGYVIGGYRFDFTLSKGGAYIIKTNETGDTTWTRMYDGGNPYALSGIIYRGNPNLQLTQDKGYMIADNARDVDQGNKGYRIFLAKSDNKGHIGCNEYSYKTRVTSITFDNLPAVNFSIVDLNPQILETPFTANTVLIKTTKICPQ